YEGRDLVAVPDGECLEVYPLPEWERMEAKLREQSRFNSEVREISRLYVSRAKDVAMDGAGRILIAPDTRKDAGLDKNVTLVGGGHGIREARAVLLDLGVSSYQLDESGRGFSFQQNEPLDMRLDPSRGETAADLVNHAEEAELARLLYEHGGERFARRIARI